MLKFLSKALAKQLSHPAGLGGHFILHALNRRNSKIIKETVNLLSLHDDDTFLDIGFGGGLSFNLVHAHNRSVNMYGAEISNKAIQRAKRKFKKTIASGDLHLKYGAVQQLPFDDDVFNHIISINTVYFWDDLDKAFREIHRILKPRATLILGLREVEVLKQLAPTDYVFHLHETSTIIAALENLGFTTTVHNSADKHPFICLKAIS